MTPRASSIRRALVPLAGVALATMALVSQPACDGDDVSNVIADTINVTLAEFSIAIDDTTSPDGLVRFDVTNAGTVMHEFLVVRTNLAADALPTNPDGSYRENGPGTTVVGEIEDIDPGADEQITLDLEEGHYVLLCNMVVGANSHYQAGMRIDFNVN